MKPIIQIDASASREFQALILGIRLLPRELAKQIRQHSKAVVEPEWQKAIVQHATTRQDVRVLADTARATVSNQNVKLRAGHLARKLSGGAKVSELGRLVEFGTYHEKYRTYQSRRGSTTYTTKRRVRRGVPDRVKNGRMFFPAAAEIIPRIAALWTQTAVRTIHEAFEGK